MSDYAISYRRPYPGQIRPRVNLNGTSKSALIEQCNEVIEAANKLMWALGAAYPHGRDYQTYGDTYAMAKAQACHRTLWDNAHATKQEYEWLRYLLAEPELFSE